MNNSKIDNTSVRKQRLDNLSIIRGISIIVVVAFHAYGMMYVHFDDATNQMYSQIYEKFNQSVLICIAMPMFVFVSGFLFSYLLSILLPFLVFSWFFMITTGDWRPLDPIIQGTYWHLWFLPMLFWCFIIYYGLYRYGFMKKLWLTIPLLMITLGCASLPKFVPMYIGLHNIHKWFFWFYLGGLVCQYHNVICNILSKYRLFLLLVSLYIIYAMVDIRAYGEDTWYSTLGNASMVIALWFLSTKIDCTNQRVSNCIISFSTYSFGIYIFHNWVELQLLSNTSKRIFHFDILAANHEILFPLGFFLIALFISWILTRLLMMTKVGKFLIG